MINENKEVVEQYIKAYETGNQDNVNAFLDSAYRYYPPGGGNPMARKARIRDETFFFSAFSEIQTTVDDQVAEGNKVACRITMKCIQTGEYQGIPATNKRVTITYMEILLLKGDKILKEWAEFDMLNILNQLK